MDEIKIAMKQLNENKCPGLDSFQIEFYTKIYKEIKYNLHSLFTKITDIKQMPNTMSTGIIALIEKAQKDPLKIKNWQPLTMLNVNYKIYAKILANRLQFVQSYLISLDQTGYMKNRNISENLAELGMVVDYCYKTSKKAIILTVDFKKAFDSVNWKAMQHILRRFGFKDIFIEMVMICFRNFKVSVINGGYTTEMFELKKGTKQGCPLSALIFLQIIEILGLKLKQNKDIKPISIHGFKKLLAQFADDLWTATEFCTLSFKAQLMEFERYAKFTGLKINYDKTEIMLIGSLQNTNAKMYSELPLHWSDGPIKILGVKFHPVMEESMQINYEEALEKAQSISQLWSVTGGLSLVGKTLIVNTLLISQFVYKLQCLPTPHQNVFERYDKIVKNFLWENRKAKIASDRLLLP